MTEYDVLVDKDGNEFWYLNDKFHRENGPAIIYASGDKKWYLNGKIHREDGPAVIYADGTQAWYKEGKLHREDGPAAIYPNGAKSWFLDDKELTEKQHTKRTQPVKELSMGELESLLGYKVKIVK